MSLDPNKMALKFELGRIFTPSAPISSYALFAGRKKQIDLLINAISQRGQHAGLYGERGVGKTSLTKIIGEVIGGASDFHVISTNCEAGTTFKSLWTTILSNIRINSGEEVEGEEESNNEQICPPDPSPEDIRWMLENSERPTVIIIDEMDRIVDRATKTRMADTIKTLSDHAVDATVLLVGVADSIEELMVEHASIARALVQIPMPRMSISELQEIINKGLEKVHMKIDPSSLHRISSLSHGLPHYTHLLALHAAQACVDRDATTVNHVDVSSAINSAITQAQHSVSRAYQVAIRSTRGNLYPQVLLACALAKTDEWGYFSAASVRDPLSLIMHKRYEIPAFAQHLKDFHSGKRGVILQRIGSPRRYGFRFIDPLMEPYVVMKGLSQGHVTADMLDVDAKAIIPDADSSNETPKLF